jgi:hypothetical protein
VDAREREEFVVRFFTFLDSATVDGGLDMPGWKDRPREYIFDYVKKANLRGTEDPDYISNLEFEFSRMIDFVMRNFPNGFRKSASGTQVPRVRFEAIAVGVGLALRSRPELEPVAVDVSDWIDGARFSEITTSDAANVRSKLLNRIAYVFDQLTLA